MIQLLETRPDGICIYEMKNEDLKVIVTSYGATITQLWCKNARGVLENVVLGYSTIDEYMERSGTYFGATVGRVCNRIAKGTFDINGKTYNVPINNGPNSLHGGIEGFSYKNFKSRILDDDTLEFFYHSADMEEGYPGNLDLTVTMSLQKNSLILDFKAQSDQDTLINITNHSYFNLTGAKENISGHLLQMDSLQHGCVDKDGMCTGVLRDVKGTPLDFTVPVSLKDVFDQKDEQLDNASGIDHHFVFDSKKDQLTLTEPKSGRKLTVSTTLPGAQIYTGNFIEPCQGAQHAYDRRWGMAIEPQFLPDGIHSQKNPDMLLKANDLFEEQIVYTFDIQG